jgi:hypothetical protein
MIYDKASLVQIPSGYKSGTLYSVVPNTADGDFTVTGDPEGEATRVNKDGLIETVAANVPRLDYPLLNGVVQDCPALLLEPSRTNIYTYSEYLGQGTTLINTTVDADSITSPSGALTGNKLTQTSGASIRKTLSSLSGTYAWSFFAKKGDLRYLNARSLFVLNGTTPANGNTIIDLDTNTIAYKGTNVTSASIQQYPNDWVKVEIVATDNATGSVDFVDFFFTDNVSGGYNSAGVAGNGYIWGVQFESSSYATSYIPNLSSGSTTRTQDDFENSFTGLTSTAATIFLDFETQALDFNFGRLFAVHDSVTSDGIYLGIYSTNTIGFFGIDGGAGLPDVKDTILLNERNKIALTFDGAGNYKYSLNGSIQTGTYVGTSRQYDEVGRGNVIGGSSNNIQIHQFMVFNEALSDLIKWRKHYYIQ